MELIRMDDLLAMKTAEGKLLAFHARNLEVAQITPEAWNSLQQGLVGRSATTGDEAHQQLRDWERSNTSPLASQVTPSSTLVINVTQICNLHCKYCAAGGDGTYGDPIKKISVEKTIPQVFSFMNRVPDGGSFQINFLGGEPLLFPDGIQILADAAREHAKERNINLSFSTVTNGTVINERSLAVLKNLRANVSVSLDGPPEVHDRRRPANSGQSSAALAIQGLRQLCEAKAELGTLAISAICGAHPDGGPMDLLKSYQFFREFPVDRIEFTFDVQETSSEISQAFVRDLERIAFLAYNNGGEQELRRIHNFNHFFETLDSQVQIKNYCASGKTQFVVDARNNVYTCPWLVGRADQVVGQGEMLWPERLTEYQNPLVEKPSCQTCWARFLCGGGCQAAHENRTGDKLKIDDLFCERTRGVATIALMYYEKCLHEQSQEGQQ